jgi:hydroxyacylglutathione hydrolase
MKKVLISFAAILLVAGCVQAADHYLPFTWHFKGIDVTRLLLGKNIANCYVVSSEKSKGAYVIDPGGNAEGILAFLKKEDLTVKGYLLTHGHNDHIKALPQLYKEMPAIAGIHAADVPLYKKRMGDDGPFDLFFEDEETYGDKPLLFQVIHTPGHSPGGVCFYFERAGVLFTGDTLFENGTGRTDLDGGSDQDLKASIKMLRKLPRKTVIFSGHGNKTTRGDAL